MKYFMRENGEVDMISLILTIVIAAVTMLVGVLILAQMDLGLPNVPVLVNTTGTSTVLANTTIQTKFGISVLSGSYLSVMTNSGIAFNFLALGLFVLAAVFIIGIVAGVLGKE
jgi:hypothetical protein